jgi:hypothetical protein
VHRAATCKCDPAPRIPGLDACPSTPRLDPLLVALCLLELILAGACLYRSQGEGGSSWTFTQPKQPEYSVVDSPGSPDIVVQVHLPGLQGAGEADLATSRKLLKVTVPGKWRLHLELPCPVDDSAARAKWSKAKQMLSITMPRAAE